MLIDQLLATCLSELVHTDLCSLKICLPESYDRPARPAMLFIPEMQMNLFPKVKLVPELDCQSSLQSLESWACALTNQSTHPSLFRLPGYQSKVLPLRYLHRLGKK